MVSNKYKPLNSAEYLHYQSRYDMNS